MIRFFDLIFSILGLLLLSPILLLVFFIVYLDSGSPIFVQKRMGKNKKPFKLYKFRTMHLNTKAVSTHLIDKQSVTKSGRIIRKAKLDELPQLINVFKGEMSLVGPRPNLYNQPEIIYEREKLGVYNVLPGITGLAQINKIDMSTPELLSRTDASMIETYTLKAYFKYIIQTITGKGMGDRIAK